MKEKVEVLNEDGSVDVFEVEPVDDIWEIIADNGDYLCLPCVVARIKKILGRRPGISDFSQVAINELLFFGHALATEGS